MCLTVVILLSCFITLFTLEFKECLLPIAKPIFFKDFFLNFATINVTVVSTVHDGFVFHGHVQLRSEVLVHMGLCDLGDHTTTFREQ